MTIATTFQEVADKLHSLDDKDAADAAERAALEKKLADDRINITHEAQSDCGKLGHVLVKTSTGDKRCVICQSFIIDRSISLAVAQPT